MIQASQTTGLNKFARMAGICVAVLVDVTEPLCIPFLILGAAVYCAVAIPVAFAYAGWVLARERLIRRSSG